VNNFNYYAPRYDRTHDINAVASYMLNKKWKLTSVISFATGQAYTLPIGRTQTFNDPFGQNNNAYFDIGSVNSNRLPDYFRIDIGATHTGTFFGGKSELQLQIVNVLNRKNIWFYQYDFDLNPVGRNEIQLLPIIPTVSYSVQF